MRGITFLMKSESQVQTEIIKYLKSIGCYYIKTIVSNRKGIVDIHGCYDGRYFAIEVKAENKSFKDVTKLQRYDLKKINDSGGMGFFANNVEYVKRVFAYYLIDL